MAPKPPNLLFLLPMPLTSAQKKKLIKYLTTALLTYSMDEIVEQELDRIYSWPTMPNSKTKKLYKNYTLVYSRAELKNLLLVTYYDALGTPVPDPADDAPMAEDDDIETTVDTPISGDLSSNDVQSSDGGNVWSLVTDAINGIVVLDPDGSYTYTPNADFIGTDSFEYQLCDADGDCSTATITIAVIADSPIPVDNVPIAVGGANSTTMDTPVSGNLSLNDTPSADGGNEWSLVENASDGTALLNRDGTYTYTPGVGFVGTDSFIYQLCDADGDCSTATVTIIVTAVSPIPIDNVPIAVGDTNTTTMDTPVSGDLSLNDTPSADGGNEWTLVGDASDGTVTLNADGTYTYTPGTGFEGVDSFTYQVCDVDGDCSTATVTITVTSNPEIFTDPTEDPTDTWIPSVIFNPVDSDSWENQEKADTGLQEGVLGTWEASSREDTIMDLMSGGAPFDEKDYLAGVYDVPPFDDPFDDDDGSS